MKVVISSGEPLNRGLANQLQQQLPPGCKLLNVYGSTEVAADATCFEVTNTRQVEGSSSNAMPWSANAAAASNDWLLGEDFGPSLKCTSSKAGQTTTA